MIKEIIFLMAVPILVETAISCCGDNPVAYYTHKAFDKNRRTSFADGLRPDRIYKAEVA